MTRSEEIKAEISKLEAELATLPERWEPSCGRLLITGAGAVYPAGLGRGYVERGATCDSEQAARRRIALITAVMRLDRWVEENGEAGEYTVLTHASSGAWGVRPHPSPLEVSMSGDTARRAAEALSSGTLVLSVDEE